MDLVTRGHQGDKSNSGSRVEHDRMLHEALNMSCLGTATYRADGGKTSQQELSRSQETLQLTNCDQPPMDWSLKEVVRC
jgi:hypothetical protein